LRKSLSDSISDLPTFPLVSKELKPTKAMEEAAKEAYDLVEDDPEEAYNKAYEAAENEYANDKQATRAADIAAGLHPSEK